MVDSAVGVSMCVLTDVSRFGSRHLLKALIVIVMGWGRVKAVEGALSLLYRAN
jgi:hypothetical protein